MGAEQIFPIGTVLKRREPKGDAWDEIRVTGTGVDLVVTSNTEFTATEILDLQVAREEYDGDFPELESEVEEGKVILVRPGDTPEQAFARTARKQREEGYEPKGRQGRKKTDPPAPVQE